MTEAQNSRTIRSYVNCGSVASSSMNSAKIALSSYKNDNEMATIRVLNTSEGRKTNGQTNGIHKNSKKNCQNLKIFRYFSQTEL